MTREEFLKTFPELIKNYQPAAGVLDHIGNIDLVMVIGPTGVGKTTLINKLDIPYVPSDVTRQARAEEKNGMDYYFRTDYDKIIQQIEDGQFVQTAVSPNGDFYATHASSYPVEGPAIMAVVADVIPIFRQLGFGKTTSIFITPPSYHEWMNRMGNHPLATEILTMRMAEAKRSLQFALSDNQTHFIMNDDIDEALTQIRQLLAGNINTELEESAKKTAKALLDGIN